tara:strand:+ start:792 stop:980 length:189 start_codon:yes stop_codon:yes gene_type:complete
MAPKEPKDLQIKIGTKEESFWTSMKKETLEQNTNARRTLELNAVLLEYCEKRIKQEEESRKD